MGIESRKFSSAPSSRTRSSYSSLSADSNLRSTNLSSWVCPKEQAWTRDCSISGDARSFVAMFCSVPFACDENTPNLCCVECRAFSALLSYFCLSLALSLWIKLSSWCISNITDVCAAMWQRRLWDKAHLLTADDVFVIPAMPPPFFPVALRF